MAELIQRGKPTWIDLPYDAGSSFLRGAARAPARIREALFSPSTNGWREAQFNVVDEDFLLDAGDLILPEESGVRESVENKITQIQQTGGVPPSLGGDHSLVFPILGALAPHHPELTLVQFDAYPDLDDGFEGARFSHACPFSRIMEKKLVRRLIQIGIRTMNKHQ